MFIVVCYAICFIIKERHIKNIYQLGSLLFVGPAVVTVTAINYNVEFWENFLLLLFYQITLCKIPFVLYRVYIYKHYNDGDSYYYGFSAPGLLLAGLYDWYHK